MPHPGPVVRSGSATFAQLAVLVALSAYTFRYGVNFLSIVWAKPSQWPGPLIMALGLILYVWTLRKSLAGTAHLDASRRNLTILVISVGLGTLGTLLQVVHLTFFSIVVWIFGVTSLLVGTARAPSFWPPLLLVALSFPTAGSIGRILDTLIFESVAFLYPLLEASWDKASGVLGGAAEPSETALRTAAPNHRELFVALSASCFVFSMLGAAYVQRLAAMAASVGLLIVASAAMLAAFGLPEAGAASALLYRASPILFSLAPVAAILVYACRGGGNDKPPPLFSRLLRTMSSANREGSFRITWACLAAFLLSAFSWAAIHKTPEPPARVEFANFPPEIGSWSSSRVALDPETERVLAADDYLAASFHDTKAATRVDLFLAYYGAQSPHRGAIHSPEVCLPNDSWNILSNSRVEIVVNSSAPAFEANRLVIEKSGRRALVYYWFEGRGKRFANELIAKLDTRADLILKGRTDGALVRFTTDLGEGESELAADSRIRSFLPRLLPQLPVFLPS